MRLLLLNQVAVTSALINFNYLNCAGYCQGVLGFCVHDFEVSSMMYWVLVFILVLI